jgi:hypothetical protein
MGSDQNPGGSLKSRSGERGNSPFRAGPEKFPPVTVVKDLFPAGVLPRSIGAPILRFAVKRYFVAGSAGVETAGPAMAVVARAISDKRYEASIFKQNRSISMRRRSRNLEGQGVRDMTVFSTADLGSSRAWESLGGPRTLADLRVRRWILYIYLSR